MCQALCPHAAPSWTRRTDSEQVIGSIGGVEDGQGPTQDYGRQPGTKGEISMKKSYFTLVVGVEESSARWRVGRWSSRGREQYIPWVANHERSPLTLFLGCRVKGYKLEGDRKLRASPGPTANTL